MIHQLVKKSNGLGELKYCRHAMRRLDEHGLERYHGRCSVLDGGVMGDLELADHFDGTVGGFWHRGCETGQNGSCGVLRIGHIGFAASLRIHRSG